MWLIKVLKDHNLILLIQQPNFLGAFDHFLGLVLKGLKNERLLVIGPDILINKHVHILKIPVPIYKTAITIPSCSNLQVISGTSFSEKRNFSQSENPLGYLISQSIILHTNLSLGLKKS